MLNYVKFFLISCEIVDKVPSSEENNHSMVDQLVHTKATICDQGLGWRLCQVCDNILMLRSSGSFPVLAESQFLKACFTICFTCLP